MDRKHSADIFTFAVLKHRGGLRWIEIVSARIDVGQPNLGTCAKDGAHSREKTERRRENGIAGPDLRSRHRQPQGVGAGRAADAIPGATGRGCSSFKLPYLWAQDELLAVADALNGSQNFFAYLCILAGKVRTGNRRLRYFPLAGSIGRGRLHISC